MTPPELLGFLAVTRFHAPCAVLHCSSVTCVAALPGVSRDVIVTLWPAFVFFACEAIVSFGLTVTDASAETIWPPAIVVRYLAPRFGL